VDLNHRPPGPEPGATRLRLEGIRTRLHRLTDAFVEGILEKPLFDDRKNALFLDEKAVTDQILDLERNGASSLARLDKFLELVKSASILYEKTNQAEKRDLVRTLTSKLEVSGKNVILTPKLFVLLVAERPKSSNSSPSRGVPRIWNNCLSISRRSLRL
jgi:site-specific DNA recombinase